VAPVLSLSIVYPQSLPKIPLVGNTSFGGHEYLRASEPSQFIQAEDQAIERMWSQLEKKIKYFFTQKGIGTLKITKEIKITNTLLIIAPKEQFIMRHDSHIKDH